MNHEAYLRIPYRDDGRDENGVDCYGLLCLVFRKELGKKIPERIPSSTVWHHHFKIHKPPPLRLNPFDIVMFAEILPGITNHVGVMINERDFLHAGSSFGGVVLEPIAKYRDYLTAVGQVL